MPDLNCDDLSQKADEAAKKADEKAKECAEKKEQGARRLADANRAAENGVEERKGAQAKEQAAREKVEQELADKCGKQGIADAQARRDALSTTSAGSHRGLMDARGMAGDLGDRLSGERAHLDELRPAYDACKQGTRTEKCDEVIAEFESVQSTIERLEDAYAEAQAAEAAAESTHEGNMAAAGEAEDALEKAENDYEDCLNENGPQHAPEAHDNWKQAEQEFNDARGAARELGEEAARQESENELTNGICQGELDQANKDLENALKNLAPCFIYIPQHKEIEPPSADAGDPPDEPPGDDSAGGDASESDDDGYDGEDVADAGDPDGGGDDDGDDGGGDDDGEGEDDEGEA